MSQNKLLSLFRVQIKCIRILFGDKEAYMNKSKTSAHSITFDCQKLDSEYYTKEHTKPLFNKHIIMTVYDLYFYHCITNLFKLLKYRSPISLFDLFKLSGIKDTPHYPTAIKFIYLQRWCIKEPVRAYTKNH